MATQNDPQDNLDELYSDFFEDDDELSHKPQSTDSNPLLDEDDEEVETAAPAVNVKQVKIPAVGRHAAETPQPSAAKTTAIKPVPTAKKPYPSFVEGAAAENSSPAHSTRATASKKRRLLNKHDFALLHFLAKADYCTTRQLALALNRVGQEDALRRKLKGLEASGFTAQHKRVGGKDLWMCTAKALAKLKKQGLIPADSRLLSREPTTITGSKIGHTLAVAQVMAQLFKDFSGSAEAILSEREIKAHHLSMKAAAQRHNPDLFKSHPQDALYKEYRDRVDLASREDLDAQLAEQLGGFSFECEQSPEGVFPELFRPMTTEKQEAYGQSPDFVLVKPRRAAGLPPRSTAVEVELNPKSENEYLRILKAYQESVFIGRVLFVVPFSEPTIYKRDGEERTKERLEDRIRKAAKELRIEDHVHINYLKTSDGSNFSGDPWSL